jgi:hypothetical protein
LSRVRFRASPTLAADGGAHVDVVFDSLPARADLA